MERVLDLPGFQKLRPFEELMMRDPIQKHREELTAVGAPITSDTYGTAVLRPGIMRA